MRVPMGVGAGLVIVVVVVAAGCSWLSTKASVWSPDEKAMITSLSLAALPALPPDKSNSVGDDPMAASLGHALFFDTRLSGNGMVACASCHLPDHEFQDGLPLANGMGRTNRRTMPIAGTA